MATPKIIHHRAELRTNLGSQGSTHRLHDHSVQLTHSSRATTARACFQSLGFEPLTLTRRASIILLPHSTHEQQPSHKTCAIILTITSKHNCWRLDYIFKMSSTRPSLDTLTVRLPQEIHQQILQHATIAEATMATPMDIDASSDPTIPPADGSSPFLALPKELRRTMFGYILPPKDKM